MKMKYFKPSIKMIMVPTDDLLTGSLNGYVDGNSGIGYGGVDTGGNKDPEAKEYFQVEFQSGWIDDPLE